MFMKRRFEPTLFYHVIRCAEVLVLFYDREQANYEIDALRAIGNLLELVPTTPLKHEEAVLAATAFIKVFTPCLVSIQQSTNP